MDELISIIIPTFNRQNEVLEAIRSVEEQSCKNWELIVVDDCSTDNTQHILKNKNNINYIKLAVNKGNAGARNAGVKNAKGKFILFLDSDDRLKKDCLKIFYRELSKKPGIEYAFGNYEIYNTTNKTTKPITWQPDPQKSFLEELKIGTGCGILIKKTCFDEVGYFDERLRVAVDTEWLIRLNKKADYVYIPENLVTIYQHKKDRVRNDKIELIKSYNIIIDKNKNEIYGNRKLKKKFFYKLQWLNYHQGLKKEGNKLGISLLENKIYYFKSFFALILFNTVPFALAKKLHLKLSGNN